MGEPKKGLGLLLGLSKGDDEDASADGSEDGSDGGDGDLRAMSDEVMEALKSGDADGFFEALRSFCTSC